MNKPTCFLSIGAVYLTDLDRAKAAALIRYSRRQPLVAPMRRHCQGFYIFGQTTLSTR